MADFKRSEIRAIEEAMGFPNGFGYVLDFSDRTMQEFFEDEFEIEIYAQENLVNGTSKRNCLTTFLKNTDSSQALRVLNELWDKREGLISLSPSSELSKDAVSKTPAFRKVIDRMSSEPSSVSSDGVEAFERDRTLEELVSDIERTLAAGKPEVAIDHLHTYCMKKITHLLKVRGIECTDDEPLHSRYGKYRKCLESEQSLHQFTERALKTFISLLESFNDLRNNNSLAHDNEILQAYEARFIFSSVSSMLVLLRTLEANKYGE